MRWFRRGQTKEVDPAQQQALLADLRQRFGGHGPGSFAEQADAVLQELRGNEGVAGLILREFADAAYAEMYAQAAEVHRLTGRGFAPDRRNYRPLWREIQLRWTLFELPLHPYVQVSAAAAVAGKQTAALGAVLEILDLTLAGWEFGRVRIDTDAATLVHRLIAAARDIRADMPDPPPLPDPVRELMRRRMNLTVLDPRTGAGVGVFDPAREMREQLLA